MRRRDFEELVARTAYRPQDAAAVLADLERQLAYEAEPRRDGLPALAGALAPALDGQLHDALPALARTASANPAQPLCQMYLCAALLDAGDRRRAHHALTTWQQADPSDPMAELLMLALAGKTVSGISEERRLANLAKFAATPLLRDPYRFAVGSIFDAIRNCEAARVLDVGAGSGAQMAALLDLLASRPHRVQRIEILALDFVEDFLDAAGETIAARAVGLEGRVDVRYRPVHGRVESLADTTLEAIGAGGPLDAVNATVALHEVAGEAKVDALQRLRRLAPRRFVLAEWNYCLENTLPATSVEFFFNVRRFLAAMVAALHARYPFGEARAVARDWLSMAGGQLICPASGRQECFLDAATWQALLEHSGFSVVAARALGEPISLIEACPGPDLVLPARSRAEDSPRVMRGPSR